MSMFGCQFFLLLFPDINECLLGQCQQTCDNTVGSFICTCEEGYEVDPTDSSLCQGQLNLPLCLPCLISLTVTEDFVGRYQ